MLVAEAAIRRYTPPTCTLEIKARQSLFSRWTGRLPLKEWHFELRFDDPRLPEEEQVTVRGEPAQLELLSDVVRAYVQNLLHQSLALACSLPLRKRTENRQEGTEPETVPHSSWPVPYYPGESARSSAIALLERPPNLPAADSPPSPNPPLLGRVKGGVAHELRLGSLAVGASHPLVKLSASQLFDLATALDEYSSEADSLAARQPFPKRKAILMGASATAILLVAAGIAAVAIKRLSPTDQPEGAVASDAQSQPPNISDVLPPVPLPPQSAPSPKLPPSLAQQQPLPPPPAVKAPAQVPRVVLPEPNPLPPPASRPSQRQIIAISPQAQGKTANPSPPPPVPGATSLNLPAPPPLAARPPIPERAGEEAKDSPAILPEPQASSSEPPRLLDTIPQVKEVRHYFQERWQVPEQLNQRLEYRLLLNQEGSLERIIPLGKAAQIYLDRTGMPLLGEPFVSPLTSGEKATIRLVFVPNGTVQTFLE